MVNMMVRKYGSWWLMVFMMIWLVVFRQPSEKWWSSSNGMMKFPTEWTNKSPCSKPPTNDVGYMRYIACWDGSGGNFSSQPSDETKCFSLVNSYCEWLRNPAPPCMVEPLQIDNGINMDKPSTGGFHWPIHNFRVQCILVRLVRSSRLR